jgi:hypothetical protein
MPYSISDVNVDLGRTTTATTSLNEPVVRDLLLADPYPAPVNLYPDLSPENNTPPVLSVNTITQNSCIFTWTGGETYGTYQLRGRWKDKDGYWVNIAAGNTLTKGAVFNFGYSGDLRNTMYGYYEVFIVIRFNGIDYLPSNTVNVQLLDWSFEDGFYPATPYGVGSTADANYPNHSVTYRYDIRWFRLALRLKGVADSELGGSAPATYTNFSMSIHRNVTIYDSNNYNGNVVMTVLAGNNNYLWEAPKLIIGIDVGSDHDFTFVYSGIANVDPSDYVLGHYETDTTYQPGDVVCMYSNLVMCIKTCTNIEPFNHASWSYYWDYPPTNPGRAIAFWNTHYARNSTFINNGTILGGGGGGGRGGETTITELYYNPSAFINQKYLKGDAVTHSGNIFVCVTDTVSAYFNGTFTWSTPVRSSHTTYWRFYALSTEKFSTGSDGLQGGPALYQGSGISGGVKLMNNGTIFGGGNGGGGGGGGTVPMSYAVVYGFNGEGTFSSTPVSPAGGDGGHGSFYNRAEVNPSVDFKYKGGMGGKGSINGLTAGENATGANHDYSGDGLGGGYIANNWTEGSFNVLPGGKPLPPVLSIAAVSQNSITLGIAKQDPIGGNTPTGYYIYDSANVQQGSTTNDTFTIAGLTSDTSYSYYVTAYNTLVSASSSTIIGKTALILPTFTFGVDNKTYNSFTVIISKVTSAIYYEIYFNDVLRTTINDSGNSTTVYATGPTMGISSTTYVKVKAYSGTNSSVLTPAQAWTTTYAAVPAVPTSFTYAETTNTTALLSWSGSGVSYKIAIKNQSNNAVTNYTSNIMNITATSLDYGTLYEISIVAVNEIGDSIAYVIPNVMLVDVYLPTLSLSSVTSKTFTVSFGGPLSGHTHTLRLQSMDYYGNWETEIIGTYSSGSAFTPPNRSRGKYRLRIQVANSGGKVMATPYLDVQLSDWVISSSNSTNTPQNFSYGWYFNDAWIRNNTTALPASNAESTCLRSVTINSSGNYTTTVSSGTAKPLKIDIYDSIESNTTLIFNNSGTIQGETLSTSRVFNQPENAIDIYCACKLILNNNGIIRGRGGSGGRGGSSIYRGDSSGENGGPGGDAIFTFTNFILYNYGTLACGGGGGGGGGGNGSGSSVWGGSSYARSTTYPTASSSDTGTSGTSGKAGGGAGGSGGDGANGAAGTGVYGTYSSAGDYRSIYSPGGSGGAKGAAITGGGSVTLYNYGTYKP